MLVAEYDVTPLYEALDVAHKAQEELRRIAHFDVLTGLPSLCFLQEAALSQLAQAKRNKQKISVMFVDLDGFKAVNDTWGHDAGDAVLKEVGERLSSCLRACDQVARIGGDEFVVLVTDTHDPKDAGRVARKIIDRLSAPIDLVGANVNAKAHIGASIGIAFYPDHGEDLDTLLKAADRCMYEVKREGKGSFHFV
jgi:diguanylate cyclase (GGDEF)-like protein